MLATFRHATLRASNGDLRRRGPPPSPWMMSLILSHGHQSRWRLEVLKFEAAPKTNRGTPHSSNQNLLTLP